MTVSRPRLAELPMLDGLRAVAALAVLLTHVGYQTGEVARSAGGAVLARLDAGVAVFFVLTGFLLYRPHAAAVRVGGPSPSVRVYAVRRAARILPAYWLALAAVVVVESAPAGRAVTYGWLGQTYTGSLYGTFTQTWSLCAEVAFYAVLPVLAVWARRAEGWVLAGLAAAGYAYVIVVRAAGLPDRSLLWLPGHLDWFAVGMGLAVVWARATLPGPPPGAEPAGAAAAPAEARGAEAGVVVRGAVWLARWPGTCWAMAGVLLWLVATPVAGPLTLAPIPGVASLVKEMAYALIGGLLLLPAALGSPAGGLGRLLAHPVSRWLGRISYGVFLWHLLVLRGVYELTGWEPFSGRVIAVLVLTVAGSVLVAAVSWVVLERPVLALAHRRTRAGRDAAPPRPAPAR